MPFSDVARLRIRNTLGVLKILGGVVLFAAVSGEVIYGNHRHFSDSYLRIQLVVCVFFMADFFLRWIVAPPGSGFFRRNILTLFFCVPYLNIVAWSGLHLPRQWAMALGLMPLLRACFASFIVVKWLAGGKVNRLLASYLFTVVMFTYLAALVFYDCEVQVNPRLHGFGDALWWAWLNLTTVGAEIFAVTTIGKVITVLLPSLGMMMFPIFTTYILEQYTRGGRTKKESDQ